MAVVLPRTREEAAAAIGRNGDRIATTAFVLAQRPSIDDLEFDVCETETHKGTAKVTQHPVESGATIADHIVDEPDTLDLVLRVSNTPLVSFENIDSVPAFRADTAYADLLAMKRAGETVGVVTSLRRYEDMAITSVSVTRDASTGQCLSVAVSLIEIRTAVSETVEAPTPRTDVPRGQTKKEKGKTATEPATAPVQEKASTTLLNFGRDLKSALDRLSTPGGG